MGTTEALQINRGQDIMVRMGGRRSFRRAYVTGEPRAVETSYGLRVAVQFAYYKPGYADTISSRDHIAVIGGGTDEITTAGIDNRTA